MSAIRLGRDKELFSKKPYVEGGDGGIKKRMIIENDVKNGL